MMKHFKGLSLSILVAFTPVIFLYSHNAKVLNLGVLIVPLFIFILSSTALYGLFLLFQRNSVSASLSTVFFLVCNYLYGTIYTRLIALNLFKVEHYVLIPIIVCVIIFAAYLINNLPRDIRRVLQTIALTASAFMVSYNVVLAVPTEIQKANLHSSTPLPKIKNIKLPNKFPDVYYLVFDEYAGFDAIHEYWHENYVNTFDSFLKANHFFVAENSRSSSAGTVHEIASRLNLKRYSWKEDDRLFLYREITDSKVMRLFKAYGYKTVVFNRTFPKFNADYNFPSTRNSVSDLGVGADEYRKALIEGTILNAFADILQNKTVSHESLDEIEKSVDKISNLDEIGSPKFVYAHILFPHPPFIVDKDGNVLDPAYSYNWNYYLGQHMYATKLAEELVTRLLANADPENPPVIILQSDHGARNQQIQGQNNTVLKNYPDKYQRYILNAFYLPGFDTSQLSDNMDPIDTFVIVMNHYLGTDLTADKTQPN